MGEIPCWFESSREHMENTKMVKVKIESDELYPFLEVYTDSSLFRDYDPPHEVPEETLERWQRVMREFEEVQTEMGKIAGWNS